MEWHGKIYTNKTEPADNALILIQTMNGKYFIGHWDTHKGSCVINEKFSYACYNITKWCYIEEPETEAK